MSGEAVEVIAHGWVVAAGAGAVVVVTLALLVAHLSRRREVQAQALADAHAAVAVAERGRADAEQARADSERGRREDARTYYANGVDVLRDITRHVGNLVDKQEESVREQKRLTEKAAIIIAAGELEHGIERRDNGTE